MYWKINRRKLSWPKLRYYPNLRLEELRGKRQPSVGIVHVPT
jgi:hypothetical protein